MNKQPLTEILGLKEEKKITPTKGTKLRDEWDKWEDLIIKGLECLGKNDQTNAKSYFKQAQQIAKENGFETDKAKFSSINDPNLIYTSNKILKTAKDNKINPKVFYNLVLKENNKLNESPSSFMDDKRGMDEIRFYDLIKKYNPNSYSKYKSIVQNKGINSAMVKYQIEFPKDGVSKTLQLATLVGKTKDIPLKGKLKGVIKSDETLIKDKIKDIVKMIPKDFITQYNQNWEKNKGLGNDVVFDSTISPYFKNKGIEWLLDKTSMKSFNYYHYAKQLISKRFPSLNLIVNKELYY